MSDNEGATGAQSPPPQGNFSETQLTTLLQSISFLRQSVDELRQETGQSRDEMKELRTRIESEARNDIQSAELQRLQPPMTPQPQPVPHSTPPPQTTAYALPLSQTPTYTLPPPQSTAYALPLSQTPTYTLPPPQSTAYALPFTHTSTYNLPQPATFGLSQQQLPLPTSSTSLTAPRRAPTLTFSEDYAVKLYPLPPFDGNPEDWPLFFANYTDSTMEFGYNNKQNLMRLHKALKGDAKNAVTSLLIYPNDVPKAIEELQFNFGRPDMLVRVQLDKVKNFPVIYENRLEPVLSFSNRVRNIVAFFKSAKCEHHLMNTTLLDQLVTKMPQSKQYEWTKFAATISPFPTVETFSIWLSELARVVSLMPIHAPNAQRFVQPSTSLGFRQANANSNRPHATSGAKRVLHNKETTSDNSNMPCLQCQQSHKLSSCGQFSALDIDDKWKFVKRNRLCFSCLQVGHSLTDCFRKKPCGINGCARLHHQLLHSEAKQPPKPVTPNHEEREHILNCREERSLSHLFKILPVILSGPLGKVSVYAMFDEGSSISLLEEKVANNLGLRGNAAPLTLQWYDDKKTTEKSRKVAFAIKGHAEKSTYDIKNIRTVKSLNLPTQTFCREDYSHLKSLPINNYNNAKPVLLLGLDNCFLEVTEHIVADGPHKPIAALTKLGWTAFGPTNSRSNAEPRVLHLREGQALKELQKVVEDYFTADSFGVLNTDIVLESDADARAKKILAETTKNIGRQYEVGLLWREENVNLPKSYAMAKQRLLNIENKMARDAVFAANYKREIDKYIAKGYARLLEPEEANRESPTTWYLPHFGVVNPSKPKKLRIVFDAAAATSNISLNSALLKGPEHAQPLWTIIAKFRQGVVAVAGDIQEMFSQVRIRAADQDSQRFLWRNGCVSMPIQVYQMGSMIFGAACSPCCAEYVKNVNAESHVAAMPMGANAVIENTYVDDLVISFDSTQEAEEVTFEAIRINAAAGFKLRNFVSNCKELEAKLNNDEVVQGETFNLERGNSTDKILGMFWNTNKDTFEFHFKFYKVPKDVLECKRPPTKREMLGIVMSVYDPFGLLANFMIYTKLLLQATWKMQITWDEPLPHEMQAYWTAWWKEFQRVEQFSTPRCYSPLLPSADDVQLHVFADASATAYAAVAYLRIQRGSEIEVAFVAAKTRCAPPKGMSVPRLELQAALLGCRLMTSIVNSHSIRISRTIFWSDSKTVILWIRSTERRYKQFVAHRIAEILANTEPSQWRWLPTSLNVADDATRIATPPKFELLTRWTLGPDFLSQREELWPKEVVLTSEHCQSEETPNRILTIKLGESVIEFTKFSSYLKLVRTVAWVLRFAHNTKPGQRKRGELAATELTKAEIVICRIVHKEVFAEEIRMLRAGTNLPKSNNLSQLTPYIDEDILRVKGRIDAAYCLPMTARRPIIMPQNHPVTHLLMLHYHQKRHHQNDSLIINEIRQNFGCLTHELC